MKRGGGWLVAGLTARLICGPVQADIHYVSLTSTNPTPPYTNWVTAATNIQSAVSVATNGETVLVSNGVYRHAAEIVVSNSILVRGVNGALVTIVQGEGLHRCVRLITNSILDGFTLTNGLTAANGGGVSVERGGVVRRCVIAGCSAASGGGVEFGSVTGMLDQCEVRDNSASANGGGVFCSLPGVILRNCLMVGNRAQSGAGVFAWDGGTLENCTVVSNSASSAGGGVYLHLGGEIINSIVYSNIAPASPNWHTNAAVRVEHTCTTPVIGGAGNLTNEPGFLGGGDYHLAANSPCLNTGSNLAWMGSAADLEGRPRLMAGRVDRGAYERPGTYYVSLSGAHQTPFTNWFSAATNISSALAVAQAGETIWVTNGSYSSTGVLLVTNPVFLGSVNGPAATSVNGAGAHRCFTILTNATVSGFSITNGYEAGGVGGGVYCSGGGVISNCWIRNCKADTYGGGAFVSVSGVLVRCEVEQNQAGANDGGGLYLSQGGLVRECLVRTNTARKAGGVFCEDGGALRNCLITDNVATGGAAVGQGGGVILYHDGGSIRNCTIVGNTSGDIAGGVLCNLGGEVLNSIVYGNLAAGQGTNYYHTYLTEALWDYCCTAPATGTHSFAADPLFLDPAGGTYELRGDSPCINAGANEAWMFGASDLAGGARIVQSSVDIGAYEATPVHYVSLSGVNGWPYLSWPAASTSIQSAVDAAVEGDLVSVTDGTYRVFAQVAVTNGITVVSVHGAGATTVEGGYPATTNRCFYLNHSNAVVDGFTITNGVSLASGGGVFINGGGSLFNCSLAGNACGSWGGAVYISGEGLVSNCLISLNWAQSGGGLRLENLGAAERCTISGNSAFSGGGVHCNWGGSLRNCLVVDNVARFGGGLYASYGGRAQNCTFSGNTATGNCGGIFFNTDSAEHGIYVQNCISYGNVDLALGNSNYYKATAYNVTQCEFSCLGPPLGEHSITGNPQFVGAGDFRLMPGSPCLNSGTNLDWTGLGVDLDGVPRLVGTNVDLGCYERTPFHYVHTKGTVVWPYLSTHDAARDIQDAVDAAGYGDTVLIEGKVFSPPRGVVVSQVMTLAKAPGSSGMPGINGGGSNRCLRLMTNAVADGLILTNGYADVGGGAYLAGGGVIRNGRLVDCRAGAYGGAVFIAQSGLVQRCSLWQNAALTNDGGAIYLAQGGVVENCVLWSNSGVKAGGIFLDHGGVVRNSLLTRNQARGAAQPGRGGAVLTYYTGTVENCTLAFNAARDSGGGVYADHGGHFKNVIVFSNAAPDGTNYLVSVSATWSNCCTVPAIGAGGLAADPLFLDPGSGDYHLPTNSPCVDAGLVLNTTTNDLDGLPRPLDGNRDGVAAWDIGAYETLHLFADSNTNGMPDGWENEHYDSPLSDADPQGDDDEDTVVNADEAAADTDPADAGSYLKILAIAEVESARSIRFLSSSNRQYTLEISTNQLFGVWAAQGGAHPGHGGLMGLDGSNDSTAVMYRLRAGVP